VILAHKGRGRSIGEAVNYSPKEEVGFQFKFPSGQTARAEGFLGDGT